MAKARPVQRSNLLQTMQEISQEGQAREVVQPLPITDISPNPYQPRRTFDDASLRDLSASIQTDGLIHPVLVRPDPTQPNGFELVDGERRFRAARHLGWATIPAIVRSVTDDQMRAHAAVANLQREDLNVIDEVDATVTLVADLLGVGREEVGARLAALERTPDPTQVTRLDDLFSRLGRGTWASFSKNKLRVLSWPPDVLAAMRDTGLPFSHASVIVSARQEPHRRQLIASWQDSRCTVTDLRQQLETLRAQVAPTPVAPTNTDFVIKVARTLTSRRAVTQLSEARQQRLRQLMDQVSELLAEQHQEEQKPSKTTKASKPRPEVAKKSRKRS